MTENQNPKPNARKKALSNLIDRAAPHHVIVASTAVFVAMILAHFEWYFGANLCLGYALIHIALAAAEIGFLYSGFRAPRSYDPKTSNKLALVNFTTICTALLLMPQIFGTAFVACIITAICLLSHDGGITWYRQPQR